jgi:hypothetical protein
MAAPDFHSPDCKLWSSRTLICWYSGLKEGVAMTAVISMGLFDSDARGLLVSELVEMGSVGIKKCSEK